MVNKKEPREDINIYVNDSHNNKSMSILKIIFISLIIFAGAFYIVTTYVAGFVSYINNGIHTISTDLQNLFHPLGLSLSLSIYHSSTISIFPNIPTIPQLFQNNTILSTIILAIIFLFIYLIAREVIWKSWKSPNGRSAITAIVFIDIIFYLFKQYTLVLITTLLLILVTVVVIFKTKEEETD